jgi:hypothetical protein
VVTGSQVDYNGSPAGYTADPQENIVYVEAHDNQTLFDIGQYHHPLDTTMDERVRAQNVGNAIVAFAQGVPFLHAGQDMLRSKSMDRNSYDSGDWFNRLDFTYQTNNWGVGLPPAPDNEANWPLIGPRLADPTLAPEPSDIERNVAVTREWFEIRMGSPLFRLETADEIQQRLTFGNTGPSQTPGLIVMSLSDTVDGLADLDPAYDGVHVLFNATDEAISYTDASLAGAAVELHPVLAGSVDPVVRTAAFDAASGTFTVPARTAAVFVDEGADVTPPEARARLRPIVVHRNTGIFQVVARCTDDRAGVTTEADINGVEVDHRDIVMLFTSRRPKSIVVGDVTLIWGRSFELTVRCTDAAGNTDTATATPPVPSLTRHHGRPTAHGYCPFGGDHTTPSAAVACPMERHRSSDRRFARRGRVRSRQGRHRLGEPPGHGDGRAETRARHEGRSGSRWSVRRLGPARPADHRHRAGRSVRDCRCRTR